ncbi:soluble lytic murein transglycosylase-like protein [Labrys wisconsinensis]|uniref:Soluble lytic murein transglycosylase-like protein n=1 Tax=Labrys wisconsinensis TaxID=425677 RepID=A0ABU0JMI6_9HYPH|nr:soluble lytic murein transglycosylase-like protein [Labrys wisconsinensis]
MLLRLLLAGALATVASAAAMAAETTARTPVDALIVKHAARYKVPESLIRRVVLRESRFNPAARHGPYWGLMQMRLDTARGMGYRGPAPGLLDADINLTYGVAYLANAWRVARGNESRAVALYSGGYYYEAKRKGMLGELLKSAVVTDTTPTLIPVSVTGSIPKAKAQ